MTHACVKPITIGNCELKNRIFFAPTTLGLKPEEKAAKLSAIAQGQTALIILPDIPVQNVLRGQLIELQNGDHASVTSVSLLSSASISRCLHW